MYKVFHTNRFEKELRKINHTFKNWLDKIENQIVKNPYVGKPIDFPWFREKKFKNYRVYFIIYEKEKSVVFVAISTKKDQQRVINSIRLLLRTFGEEIKELLKST